MRPLSLCLLLLFASSSVLAQGAPPPPPPPLFEDGADSYEGLPPSLDELPPKEPEKSPARRPQAPSPPRAETKERAAPREAELPEWDATVAIASGGGCVLGGLLFPSAAFAVGVPLFLYATSQGLNSNAACTTFLAASACMGLGVMGAPTCSAATASASAVGAALYSGKDPWRPLMGAVPGALLSSLSVFSCLCLALPTFGVFLMPIAFAISALGGPLVVVGASLGDADVFGGLFGDKPAPAREEERGDMPY